MHTKRWIGMVFWLVAGVWPASLPADEVEVLKQQVAEQGRQIQSLQEKLEQLETQDQKNNQILARHINELNDKYEEPQWPDKFKWIENLKIYGDFRYRHETIEAENDSRADQHRNRIRARIGLDTAVNEEWSLGFRLAGGSDDPVSTNQTLGSAFSSKSIWIDLAYADYHPLAVPNLNIIGGKMSNPFVNVGKNQLIWDGDLTPEGLAGKYKYSLSETDELFASGGGFWVTESSSGNDVSLWGAQGGWKHSFDKTTYALGGISYYDYGNIQDQGPLYGSKFFGNSSANNVFVNDYNLVELFAEAGTKIRELPVSLYGNYVTNCAADTGGDTGWLVGCTLNKAKDPGSWEFSYDYRDLEKDAVVGTFSDSDFIGGGTDGKGSRFGAAYQITKNVQTAVSYFLNERGLNDDAYRRLQVDLLLKF